MEGMTLGDVLEAITNTGRRKMRPPGSRIRAEGKGALPNHDSPVRGISVDSRTIQEGEVFFALQGPRFNGHHFAQEVLEKGALTVVIRRDFPLNAPAEKVITVEDPLRALGDLARSYRQRFSLPIIAITGSNGKTTTKEMTAAILSTQYNLLKSKGSYNNVIGIPLTLFHLSKSHEVVVLEFGINQPGEMERLCEIATPSVGVITHIGETHLQFLGSLEGVREEKAKILDPLDSGDT
ncbi:UDP-N-acetylmuramoyl-tripeptide--D-alanyl-D-alanine ligase, partial [candidate division TA06 bacterium]|nr:UDP-N-acetylmuramoyl-tripeptide--D-alanyl-D-alanine ligase [candidate division TA06 bacterium]